MSSNFKINYVCNKAIVGIAKGNIDALSDIYDIIGKQIYFIAYSILKNYHDAEDAMQEALYEIVKCSNTYKPMSNARLGFYQLPEIRRSNTCAIRKLRVFRRC